MNAGEFREAGHQVADLLAEYLEKIEERPQPLMCSRRPLPSSSPRHCLMSQLAVLVPGRAGAEAFA